MSHPEWFASEAHYQNFLKCYRSLRAGDSIEIAPPPKAIVVQVVSIDRGDQITVVSQKSNGFMWRITNYHTIQSEHWRKAYEDGYRFALYVHPELFRIARIIKKQ